MGYIINKFIYKDSVVDRFDNDERETELYWETWRQWIGGCPKILLAKTRPHFKAFDIFRAANLISSKNEMKKYSPKINGVDVGVDEEIADDDFIHALAFSPARILIEDFGRNIFHLQLSKKIHCIVRIGNNIKRLI